MKIEWKRGEATDDRLRTPCSAGQAPITDTSLYLLYSLQLPFNFYSISIQFSINFQIQMNRKRNTGVHNDDHSGHTPIDFEKRNDR